MFLINIDRNRVDIPHRDKMTTGSAGFLVAELNFSKDWYRTDLEVYVYFASTTGFRLRKKLVDLIGKPLHECAWDDFAPRIPISALATAEPGVVQIGFMAEDSDENLVIPTIWGTLGPVEKSVLYGEVEVPEPDPILPEEPDDPTLPPDNPGDDTNPGWTVGHGLKLEENVLSVNSVDDFNGDNTLPITAAAVLTITGNIEALLKTI